MARTTAPTSTPLRMRAFNRFYTERIGVLDERHEGLALTIAESRCLFTIRAMGAPDLGEVAAALRLDLGYVSRLVGRLEQAGRVRRRPAKDDRRRRLVTLTRKGEALLADVEARSNRRMDELTAHLDTEGKAELFAAMDAIQRLLDREVS